MKLVRLVTTIFNLTSTSSKFQLGNATVVSSYSTIGRALVVAPDLERGPWDDSFRTLYRRISPIGDPKVSILPVLDQWIEQGRTVSKPQLRRLIKLMRSYRRFSHALEISIWMSDKRFFPLACSDVAIRLDLIAKVRGIEPAESYFDSIPIKFKTLEAYSTLLNCYVYVRSVEKAEATMQKMMDLGFPLQPLNYNCLLTLYYQTANHEKLNSLILEMDEKGICCDRFTYGILMSAYAAISNVDGIDKILTRMESDSSITTDWATYATAGSSYAKVGQLDKALAMLKKSERLMSGKDASFQILISQYGKYGKKDEVLRLWKLYKTKMKVSNKGYICIISSMLNLDDLETAEKIFEEWEFQNLNYDIRIPNFLVGAYSRKGFIAKAEILVNKAISKGGKPNLKTWYSLATGYLQGNQIQKGVEMMKEAVMICRSDWKPRKECLAACLEYFKCQGDMDGAEKFVKLLRDKDIIAEELEEKLRNYFHCGKNSMDDIVAAEE